MQGENALKIYKFTTILELNLSREDEVTAGIGFWFLSLKQNT
jgi:hypothetical protein